MAESIKVAGTVMWANLEKVNDMSGKYQFDLCNLSQAAAKALEGLGLNTRTNDNKPELGIYITFKSVRPIRAYNPDGTIIDQLVGNGSTATVVAGYYDWAFKGKKGRSPSCVKLVINNLQVFGGSNEEESEDDMVL